MAKAETKPYGNAGTAPAPKREGKKELYCIEVKPAENGGFVADHRYRMKSPGRDGRDCAPCGYVEPETFALADKAALLAHLTKAL